MTEQGGSCIRLLNCYFGYMEEGSWMEWVKREGWWVAIGAAGLGILIYGLWSMIKPEPAVVEIVKEEETRGEIVVDVAGAVEKPGIYKIPTGSRIGDALVMAGGFAAEADREWVSQYLNLAEEVKDGGKIYIPGQAAGTGNQKIQIVGQPDAVEKQILGAAVQGRININTASQSELESLWGIGEARAKAIISNRPYGVTEELVSKAKIPQSVYDKIREQISVY